MEKNKYDFILDILESKKLNQVQKERVLLLTKKELKKDRGNFNELDNRVRLLEEKFIGNSKEIENSQHKKLKDHSPIEMVDFLSKFSKDEQLKWFTHKPDFAVDKINYYQILQNIDQYLKKIITKNLNFSTTSFVENFIRERESKLEVFYPKFTLKLSYNNKNIIEQIKNGLNPFDIKIDGEYFVDYINRFKTAIEFRLDKPNFKFQKLFKDFISDKISVDFIEEYTNDFDNYSNSLSTYIDVNNFFRGIDVIIDWININKTESTKLSIDLKNLESYYELVIFHENGKFLLPIDSPKLTGNSGDFQKLKKYWFSIVDFYIYADFKSEDKSFKINCLTKNSSMYKDEDSQFKVSENEISKPLSEKTNGVKYVIHIFK